MSDLRDKIARVLFDHDFNGVTRRAGDAVWILVRDRTDEDSTWHRAADAVLAVIDVGEIRAEAALERVREAATEVANQRNNHGRTHYENCWKQHLHCLAAKIIHETGAEQ